LIWSPECYLVRSRQHKVPRCVVFSTLLLHRLRRLSRYKMAAYLNTLASVNIAVPREWWERKFTPGEKGVDQRLDG
jgi:hypothetical protein